MEGKKGTKGIDCVISVEYNGAFGIEYNGTIGIEYTGELCRGGRGGMYCDHGGISGNE